MVRGVEMADDEDVAGRVAAAEYAARVLSLEDYPTCPWRGNPKVDGIVWPYNDKAPDPSELGCAIEVYRHGGSWHNIPTSAGVNKWGLDECSESAILMRWGGGRRYRASIRWSGSTLPGSMVYHNLDENQTPPRAIPGLPRELDTALAGRPETGMASLPEGAPRAPGMPENEPEPLQSLSQILAVQHQNPALALLSVSLDRLTPEAQFVASALLYVIQEQRSMSSEVQRFTLTTVQALTSGRNAPPDVAAIWRDLAAESRAKAEALAAKVESLKEHQHGAPPPPPFSQKLVEKAVEAAIPAVIARIPQETLNQALAGASAMAGGR